MKKNLLLAAVAASVSVMAFAGCTNENTVSGKTVDVVEETMTEETEAMEAYMTIDGYTMAGGMIRTTLEDETTEETGALGYALEEGKTIGEILTAEGISTLDVFIMDSEDPDSDIFEGWIEYKVTVMEDEEGLSESAYERMSGDTYYTTEELLAMPAPDYEVLYVAKWEAVSEEDYFKQYEMVDDGLDLFLTMYANGGYLWYDGEEPYDFDLGVYAIEKDQTFGFMIDNEELISEHNDYSWFAGWTVYTGESIEWLEEEPAEVDETSIVLDIGDNGYGLIHNYEVVAEGLTMEELMELTCEGTEYVAIAMWE